MMIYEVTTTEQAILGAIIVGVICGIIIAIIDQIRKYDFNRSQRLLPYGFDYNAESIPESVKLV